MDDLIAFLNSRLNEDEQAAAAAKARVDEITEVFNSPDDPTDYASTWDGASRSSWTGAGEPINQHLVRHDPVRVLADVAAKQQIIELYRAIADSRTAADAWVALKYVVRQLAVPFADHPDYREEWKP